MTCPLEAIEHDDENVVVDASKCNNCMDCIPVCPTGSIDEWRVVNTPYSLEEQYEWEELPEQGDVTLDEQTDLSQDNPVDALLAEAHQGAGGKTHAPASASTPTINLYPLGHSIEAVVQGNYRITDKDSDSDVRHIILDFKGKPFPVLEGQSLGILPPGTTDAGKAHLPRLYSASSPRDGERPGFHNVSLTVKRDTDGVCSDYLCDLSKGDTVNVIGPYGSTFLLPTNPNARLLMICTGTGSAPMRSFTMARERNVGAKHGGMVMFFGAQSPETLPYFGPLEKIPEALLQKHLVFSRQGDKKEYVQDRMREQKDAVTELLQDKNTHIYICGLKNMEHGVEAAFSDIAASMDSDWNSLKETLRAEGRYHVETY
jgi:benzoyl-CoA 2,3-dioxygenase component A